MYIPESEWDEVCASTLEKSGFSRDLMFSSRHMLDYIGYEERQQKVESRNSWVKSNVHGRWETAGWIIAFELETDAIMYKLRWM